MSRAPFQVLVIPFRRTADGVRYALFHRADADVWQWIAGGGESGELPIDAARREAHEEAGLAPTSRVIELDAIASIPVVHFAGHEQWGSHVHVVPEHSFGIEVIDAAISIAAEHRAVEWLDYDEATRRATFDSNRTALWELNRRLERETSR